MRSTWNGWKNTSTNLNLYSMHLCMQIYMSFSDVAPETTGATCVFKAARLSSQGIKPFTRSTCSNFCCSAVCLARWNRRQHPNEDNGVQERGGHVGHQGELQKEVWSVSLHHHPGTAHSDTKLRVVSLLSVSVYFTVFLYIMC